MQDDQFFIKAAVNEAFAESFGQNMLVKTYYEDGSLVLDITELETFIMKSEDKEIWLEKWGLGAVVQAVTRGVPIVVKVGKNAHKVRPADAKKVLAAVGNKPKTFMSTLTNPTKRNAAIQSVKNVSAKDIAAKSGSALRSFGSGITSGRYMDATNKAIFGFGSKGTNRAIDAGLRGIRSTPGVVSRAASSARSGISRVNPFSRSGPRTTPKTIPQSSPTGTAQVASRATGPARTTVGRAKDAVARAKDTVASKIPQPVKTTANVVGKVTAPVTRPATVIARSPVIRQTRPAKWFMGPGKVPAAARIGANLVGGTVVYDQLSQNIPKLVGKEGKGLKEQVAAIAGQRTGYQPYYKEGGYVPKDPKIQAQVAANRAKHNARVAAEVEQKIKSGDISEANRENMMPPGHKPSDSSSSSGTGGGNNQRSRFMGRTGTAHRGQMKEGYERTAQKLLKSEIRNLVKEAVLNNTMPELATSMPSTVSDMPVTVFNDSVRSLQDQQLPPIQTREKENEEDAKKVTEAVIKKLMKAPPTASKQDVSEAIKTVGRMNRQQASPAAASQGVTHEMPQASGQEVQGVGQGVVGDFIWGWGSQLMDKLGRDTSIEDIKWAEHPTLKNPNNTPLRLPINEDGSFWTEEELQEFYDKRMTENPDERQGRTAGVDYNPQIQEHIEGG